MPADEAIAVNIYITTYNISGEIVFFKANYQVNDLIFLRVFSEKR